MSAKGWKQLPQSAEFIAAWRQANPDDAVPRMYRRGNVQALVGREKWRDGTTRWHISVSGNGRVPTWDELVKAAHDLRPGVPFCMGVPPETWWMNVHPHVLHMWETNDPGLIEQWRDNARGDRPT